MKLSSINNASLDNNKKLNKNQKTQGKNVNFTGATDAVVKFWQFVDNGGRAIQFTVEDMFGTNLPRTYKGAMAGYKYTGKVNVLALMQEAIREFLTGPTMTIAPCVVLWAAKKNAGKVVNVEYDNIKGFSQMAKNMLQNVSDNGQKIISADEFRNEFYKSNLKDILLNSSAISEIPQGSSIVEDLNKAVAEYKSILDTKPIDRAHKKELKRQAESVLANIQQVFENFVKSNRADYDTNFLNAKFTIKNKIQDSPAVVGETKFKNYIGYMIDYGEDFIKKHKGESENIYFDKTSIEKFAKNSLGRKALTAFSMIAVTIGALSVIPKIYTWASGGVNPNASAIYNEASKAEAKEVK